MTFYDFVEFVCRSPYQVADIDALYDPQPFGPKSWSSDALNQPPQSSLDVWYSRRPRIQRPAQHMTNPNYNPESHYDYPPNYAGDLARSANLGNQHYYDDPYAMQTSTATGPMTNPMHMQQQQYQPTTSDPYGQLPYQGYPTAVGTEPRRGRRGTRHAMPPNYHGAPQTAGPRRPTYNIHDPAIKRILITKDPNAARSGKAEGMGLKVIGGKLLPGTDGELGAYVAAVYKQAMVETMGQVKEGDQVLEWNGIPLTGRTYEEVQRIIAESSGEIEVVIRSDANLNQIYSMKNSQSLDKGYESAPDSAGTGALTSQYQYEDPYSVPMKPAPPPIPPHRCVDGRASPSFSAGPGTPGHHQGYPMTSGAQMMGVGAPSNYPGTQQQQQQQLQQQQQQGYMETTPYGGVQSQNQMVPAYDGIGSQSGVLSGQIKLGVSFEQASNTLFVSVFSGKQLSVRATGQAPNPFVKIYLLPGRRVENKRRTKYQVETTEPDWNQTVVYKDLMPHQLGQHYLEFTVWDYDKFGQNFFLGQVILSLADTSILNGQAHWYRLHDRDNSQVTTAGPWPIANDEFTGYYAMNPDDINGNLLYDGSY